MSLPFKQCNFSNNHICSFPLSPYSFPLEQWYSLSDFCLPQSTIPDIKNRIQKWQHQRKIKFLAIGKGAKCSNISRVNDLGKFILKMTTKVETILQRLKDSRSISSDQKNQVREEHWRFTQTILKYNLISHDYQAAKKNSLGSHPAISLMKKNLIISDMLISHFKIF